MRRLTRLLDRAGEVKDEGINVGDIWEHRSYVEGGQGSRARASYLFTNVSSDMLVKTVEVELDEQGNEREVPVERLRLESSFEAFRTFKGDMERSLLVQYHFVRDLRTQMGDNVAGVSVGVQGVGDMLAVRRDTRQGNFRAVADEFLRLSNGYRTRAIDGAHAPSVYKDQYHKR